MTNLEISSAAAEPNTGSLARRCVMGAGILGILIVVSVIANGLWLKILTSVAIYTLTAASIALLYRRLGLVSLAQVAMMGIGGWVALRLAHGTNLPFEMNVLCGGLLAGLVGMVLSYPALRMRGLYLALVTLMAAGGFGLDQRDPVS